jgi:hypothetical protein
MASITTEEIFGEERWRQRNGGSVASKMAIMAKMAYHGGGGVAWRKQWRNGSMAK